MGDRAVKTPCIGVCSTGIGDRVCRGCKRFAHEVVHWNTYTEAEKCLIEDRLSQFLSQCIQNRLQVLDKKLLETRLKEQRLRYPKHRDEFCWAYCLIKAGGSQIAAPEEYGLTIKAEFRDMPLDRLRRLIDEDFFALSDAYYERYVK